MAEALFVVVGTTGEYSDRREWFVCFFDRESAARDYAVACKRLADVHHAEGYLRDIDYKHPLDPNYRHDYTGTDYTVAEVPAGPLGDPREHQD